jgi:hypothetical protein
VIPAVLALAGALGLAGILLPASRLTRVAALLLAASGTIALLVWLGADDAVRARPAPSAAAAVAGLPLALLAARAVRRAPVALAVAVCLAVPFRVPVHFGGQSANLLVPLYLVIAVGWLALLLGALADERPPRLPPAAVAVPALLLLAWEALSLAWSASATEGAKTLAFYALPFGVLLAALVALPPPCERLRTLVRLQVALALAFAALGLYQVLFHDIWWNRSLMVSNAFSSFFRANSAFYDPSIFGRYEAVTIALVFALLLFGNVPRPLVAAAAAGLVWVGMLTSYSQSSMLALCVAVAAGLALVYGRRLLVLLVAAALVGGLALAATPEVRHSNLEHVTSTRARLVEDGLRLFRDHPVAGVGFGGSAEAARRLTRGGRIVRHVQHVMPLTIASELGVVGVALAAWLLAAVARLALAGGRSQAVRLALGLALLTILVHSLFYAAFFEDPLTWCLIALLAVCSGAGADWGRVPLIGGLRSRAAGAGEGVR